MSDRRAACDGKKAFVSPVVARSHLAEICRSGKYSRLYVYRCCFCGAWHLGSIRLPEHRPEPKDRFQSWRRCADE